MPLASPALRRLRIRAGVKSGLWAERVQINRNHYVNVEGGHKPGSQELFARCASALTELLGERVEPDQLIADAGDSAAERASTEATETASTTEATDATATSGERERAAS